MIDARDYFALSALDILGRNYTHHGITLSLDHRIDRIYSYMATCRDDARIYALSKSIPPRIDAMDISKLTPEAILCITKTNYGQCGSVLDPMGEKTKVSFNFAIFTDYILLDVYLGNVKDEDLVRYANKVTDDTAFANKFVGSVIISPSGIEKVPNSVLTLLERKMKKEYQDRVDNIYTQQMRAMYQDAKRIPKDAQNAVQYVSEHPSEYPVFNGYVKQYQQKLQILEYALKTFIYIHSSQTITLDYISEGVSGRLSRTGVTRNYIQVDALWDAEVNVINPFSVRGHFTHQPYGKDSALRKLIYIEEYMKKGYHRRATKDIVNDEGR